MRNPFRFLKRSKPKGKMTLSAVVIRADGTREDLGVIAEGPITITPESG